jgi:hypothetical protein
MSKWFVYQRRCFGRAFALTAGLWREQRLALQLIGGLLLGSSAQLGCGAEETQKPPVDPSRAFDTKIVGADDSHCDYKGRKDRVVMVTAATDTHAPNVRRVYAVGINQKDGKRILRCREADTNRDGMKDVFRTYNEKGEPIAEFSDSNYDGKVDTWLKFVRNKVSRADVDHNADGRPDEHREYVNGVLSRVQRDKNYDGKVDSWEVYEEGRLNRIGTDLDGDEKVDRWMRDTELVRRDEAEAKAEAGGNQAAAE